MTASHETQPRTLREVIESGDAHERSRAMSTLYSRVRSGWDRDRALNTPAGTRPGPQPGYRSPAKAARSEAVAGVSLSHSTRFCDDDDAQRLVAEHPDGMTLEQVAALFGVTVARVQQIESAAIKRLRLRCAVAGIEPEDVAQMLGRAPERGLSGPVVAGPPGRPPDAPLPACAWSEQGERVEAACAALDEAADRLTATLVRVGRGV